MKKLLILNPASGQGKAARAKRNLLDHVAKLPNIDVKITINPNDATELGDYAAKNNYDRVIVAGGDGTINQVINGIGDSRIPVGIIPLGTGNVLAHDLGLPAHGITKALSIIQMDRIREVDLGKVGNKRFLLMAGLGFDAAIVDSVSGKVKDIFGSIAYVSAALEQLIKYTPSRFRLIFDNGSEYETDAFGVIVANCGSYAYSFKIAPEAVFDDGLLDVLVLEKTPGAKFEFIGKALEAVFQQPASTGPSTTYFKVARVRIESDPQVKMQIDGDVAGESGVDIEVLPGALRLIVP